MGGGSFGGGAPDRGGGGNFAASAVLARVAEQPLMAVAATSQQPEAIGMAAAATGTVAAGIASGGFWPGVAAGAAIGAIGSSYAYYGDGPYYGDGYYDDSYYTTVRPSPSFPTMAAIRRPIAPSATSYDPASGTYLGYDGLRHPCP